MKTRALEYGDGCDGLSFWCEGCGRFHTVTIAGPGAWSWNGDRDAPALHPSVLVTTTMADMFHVCHSFVGSNGAQPGEIIFLADCTHHLAGQVRPLIDCDSAPE